MLSRIEAGLNLAGTPGHKIEEIVQHFIGKARGGFAWERQDRSRDPDWIKMLLDAVHEVYGDLRRRFEDLTGEKAQEEETWLEKSVLASDPSLEVLAPSVEFDFVKTPSPEKRSSSETVPVPQGSLRKSRKPRAAWALSLGFSRTQTKTELDAGKVHVKVI